MGRYYEELGRYTEALLKFDKIIKINPSHVEARENKNRISVKMGKISEVLIKKASSGTFSSCSCHTVECLPRITNRRRQLPPKKQQR